MKIGRFALKPRAQTPEDEYNDPPRPFIEHLIDLRDCVVRCALAWGLCQVAIIPFVRPIVAWLKAPAGESQNLVQGLSWTIGFDIILRVMLWGGTALSLPFLLFFIMRFVFPGLKRSERSIIVFVLVSSTVLFSGGVWMAYSTTLSVAIKIMQMVNRWVGVEVNTVQIDKHIDIVIKMIIAFGLAFQLPLLLLVLGWIGLVSSEALRKQRRLAIVVIFILAMVLTPPDPASQVVMAIPMCLLYEACIWVIRLRELAKGRREERA